mmetsp:Transcript_2827/g.5201  ORF Transcript_2827/g.5201 Transcript_2827/m.5201 type:complete len:222 (-) Transcript_2827:567-1232(-)
MRGMNVCQRNSLHYWNLHVLTRDQLYKSCANFFAISPTFWFNKMNLRSQTHTHPHLSIAFRQGRKAQRQSCPPPKKSLVLPPPSQQRLQNNCFRIHRNRTLLPAPVPPSPPRTPSPPPFRKRTYPPDRTMALPYYPPRRPPPPHPTPQRDRSNRGTAMRRFRSPCRIRSRSGTWRPQKRRCWDSGLWRPRCNAAELLMLLLWWYRCCWLRHWWFETSKRPR